MKQPRGSHKAAPGKGHKLPPKAASNKGGGKGRPPQYPQGLQDDKMRSTAHLDKSGFAKTKPALVTMSGPYNRGQGLAG